MGILMRPPSSPRAPLYIFSASDRAKFRVAYVYTNSFQGCRHLGLRIPTIALHDALRAVQKSAVILALVAYE